MGKKINLPGRQHKSAVKHQIIKNVKLGLGHKDFHIPYKTMVEIAGQNDVIAHQHFWIHCLLGGGAIFIMGHICDDALRGLLLEPDFPCGIIAAKRLLYYNLSKPPC